MTVLWLIGACNLMTFPIHVFGSRGGGGGSVSGQGQGQGWDPAAEMAVLMQTDRATCGRPDATADYTPKQLVQEKKALKKAIKVRQLGTSCDHFNVVHGGLRDQLHQSRPLPRPRAPPARRPLLRAAVPCSSRLDLCVHSVWRCLMHGVRRSSGGSRGNEAEKQARMTSAGSVRQFRHRV